MHQKLYFHIASFPDRFPSGFGRPLLKPYPQCSLHLDSGYSTDKYLIVFCCRRWRPGHQWQHELYSQRSAVQGSDDRWTQYPRRMTSHADSDAADADRRRSVYWWWSSMSVCAALQSATWNPLRMSTVNTQRRTRDLSRAEVKPYGERGEMRIRSGVRSRKTLWSWKRPFLQYTKRSTAKNLNETNFTFGSVISPTTSSYYRSMWWGGSRTFPHIWIRHCELRLCQPGQLKDYTNILAVLDKVDEIFTPAKVEI